MMLVLFSALADIPPPRGYVEQCTVERQQSATKECTGCSAWHGGRERCEVLKKLGYEKQCKTRGASTWLEVHCRARSDAAIPEVKPAQPPKSPGAKPPKTKPAPPTEDSGCSTAAPWPGFLAMFIRRS